MKPRTSSRLAWSLWGLVVALLAGSLALGFLGDIPLREWVFVVLFPVFLLASATVGALIASRQPGNAIGWILMATALLWAISQALLEVVRYIDRSGMAISEWVVFLDWLGAWIFTPGIYLPVTFVFLLFPDGRLPSSRWRPVGWMSAIGIIGIALTSAFPPGSHLEDAITFKANPYAIGSDAFWDVFSFVWIFAFGGLLGSVTALVMRLRRSSGPKRQQVKWLAYAGAVAVVAFTIAGVLWGVFPADATAQIIGQVLIILALLLIPLAAGTAILRYRLYDIDVVIRKTVLFGVLTAFITLIYGAVVLLVPVVIFGAGERVSLLPALATVVVALVFQPLRRRASRLANRLVYGKRATPYELLARFSGRVGGEYAIEDVLPRMARVLAEGTGSRRADVWLRVGGGLRRAASWPPETEADVVLRLDGDGLPALPEADLVEQVRHRGELLGALSLAKPRGETVRPAEETLLRDLASQAGLVLRNVRLTAELEDRLRQLQESRQRLVAAQDEERRRLERNIHDGAQQQLVALSVRMRLLKTLARKDPGKAEELVDQLQADAQDALNDLRDLARGIYPPLLADQGLAAALEAQARKAAVPVEVHPDGIGRYPQEAEATAYFCVLEALQNVAKYAGASRAVVRLEEDDGRLVFSVTDDGAGFDVDATPRGAGLQNMTDRVEALGGTLTVSSAPGSGTTISGSIPVGV